MFEYISGKLIQKTDNYAVVESNGIGYRIYSTLSSLADVGEAGDTVKMYIYVHINTNSDIFSLICWEIAVPNAPAPITPTFKSINTPIKNLYIYKIKCFFYEKSN